MQVNNFFLFFFCCIFGVYAMRFIYMVFVKEIVFTCVIYAVTLYHYSEHNITDFFVTWVLLWFRKGFTHMVSSALSDINAYFSYLG